MTTPAATPWIPAIPKRTPPELWGADHWDTLTHLEVRVVEHQGFVNPANLRINPRSHHSQYRARTILTGNDGGFSHSTAIKASIWPDADGNYARAGLPGHDDYDCMDDLLAAQFLIHHWPTLNEDGTYTGVHGQVTTVEGDVFHPHGMNDRDIANLLSMHARWALTERGWATAHRLRRYIASGGDLHNFSLGRNDN